MGLEERGDEGGFSNLGVGGVAGRSLHPQKDLVESGGGGDGSVGYEYKVIYTR